MSFGLRRAHLLHRIISYCAPIIITGQDYIYTPGIAAACVELLTGGELHRLLRGSDLPGNMNT